MNTERYKFPLSFAQQRLWFLDQLEEPNAVYTIRLPIRLTGPLNRAGLQDAVDYVVARHESLRTTFTNGDGNGSGEPVQVITSDIDVPVQWHELTDTRPAAIHARVGELAAVPFDLATGPLLRVHVLRIAAQEHLLLLLCHHIVSDAWSSGVLFSDLAVAYDALVAGETPSANDLPVQYADYTVWQLDWFEGPELTRQLEYWRAALAGAPATLPLPTDRPRPPRQTYNGKRLTRVMPAALPAALNALAGDNSCTLFMVLLAAFNVLLSRYTGQDDICIGSPIAGRRRTELEGLVGLFVNTLVLRTDLSGRPGFLELLARVRRSTLAAFAHQELPFEKLVEALQPVRDQSRSPLFQTMFILQNAPWEAQPIHGIDVKPGEAGPVNTAKFDLTVSAHEYEDKLWLNLEYNTDLFDEQTIEGLADSYESLLHAIARNPERSIHELDLLTAKQHRNSADTATSNVHAFDETLTVHGLITGQVHRTPDAIALEFEGRTWTYRKLDARAASLAECLVELLPRTKSPFVAICTERAPVMLTAVLGVLQSGAGYVPLDRTYPARRLRYMLDDSGAGILITQTGIVGSLPAFDGAIVLLTDDGRVAEIRMPVVERTHEDAGSDSLIPIAYLIYTSGSTGRPKGVRIGHRAVVNFLLSMAREPGITAADRLLAVTTLSFDIAVLELLLPLTVGATVIIASTETAGDGRALASLVHGSLPTIMQATPATWHMLINAGWTGSLDLRILCGGESLVPGLARQLLESGCELWNMYGPTETTIWSTCERIVDTSTPMTIGRPIANTTTRVLDAGREAVPVGVVGELYIGGHGLADGYHAREELTAKSFVADPITPGAKLYRTGDRARYRNDGKLELLGRMDRQVKLRGFRIELGEIEAALDDLADVNAAAVVLSEERLVAYVVPAAARIDGDVLRAVLRDRLPEYMLPSLFVALDALPLTPNGKIDRRQLPAPDPGTIARAGDASARVAPSGPLQAALAGLFADVLGLPGIGATDNFFSVGGHSLLATQLVSRIRDALAVELPLRALFDEPTVAGLAGLLASDDTDRRALAIADRTDRLVPRDPSLHAQAPASLMQQRLWFLDQLEPGSSTYNLAWCLRLVGELDRTSLEAAVQALVARHEVLRTTFIDDGGAPRQHIAEKLAVDVEFTTLVTAVADVDLRSSLNDLAKRPFALAVGPLLRVHVVETGIQEQVLLVVIHHIIADGWSMSVLFGELSAAYNAFRRGETPSWLPLPVQYADYAVWQRDRLTGMELAKQAEYWCAQLDGAPPLLELPTDRPRPAVQSHHGARVSRLLTAGLSDAVNGLARDEDCTLFMVLAATLAVVLGRYAGTHDVVVGTPIAGRGQTELEGLIGFFVNTLVLRTRLDGNPTFRELLARVRRSALDAYAHQDLPFEKLVDELRPERHTGRTPIFQVLFNLHNEPVHAAGFDALDGTPIGIDRGLAKFDLTISISESSRGESVQDNTPSLLAHFEFNSDLFAEDTIVEFSDYTVRLLETFVADPDLRLNALPSLAAPELIEWTDWTGTIVNRFVAQARRAPKAIAVRSNGSALSYGEVNEQANALAVRLLLLELAADPDTPRIGVMCAQDTLLAVGLVGILKAGCAWVPLDPSWPAARLAWIVRDAELGAIITDAGHADRARALSASLLPVVELDGEAAAADPPATIEADALACIIYTSGSTGTPKGVMQTHRGIVTQVGRYTQALNLNPADRLSGLSGYAYDASVQDIFGALLNGATVCLYDVRGERLAENTALVAAMVADGITVVHAAPSLYRYLFGGDLNCAHDLSTVRLVVLGGEPVRRSDFELYRSRFAPGTRFINGLGLTESTLALQFHADSDTRLVGQSVPVGNAVAGLGVELVDDNGEPGWYGEIVLTGTGLSPGYWRQPEQTAECFGPGPVLRTGDIGRRLPDGRIVYVGRRDQQVNIRGFRVEPGEIESVLGALAGVSDCAVTVVERHGDPWLVAYAVAAERDRPDTAALRNLLAERLPVYMVPQAIEWLEALPRHANGKLARTALPAPRLDRATGAGLVVPARSELEGELLSIWGDVLQLKTLGVHDDFFALGGHSLLATRVIARIRDRLKIDVPLINLFEYPTIAGFADSMTHLYGRETGPGTRDELISVTR